MDQQEIIKKFSNLKNDQIGDGVFIAFEWSDKILCRIYIGTKQCGPMLQWFSPTKIKEGGYTISTGTENIEIDPNKLYNGVDYVDFENGGWTNLYSRGNFKKKYAYGGNWSGHTHNLIHPLRSRNDKKNELLNLGEEIITLPEGIRGDIQHIDMDCSGSWTIFYKSAKEALDNRLPPNKINSTILPMQTKAHLIKNETPEVLDNLSDVIDAYDI